MGKKIIYFAVLYLIALSIQANAEQIPISPKYILLNEYNPDYSNSPLEIYVGAFQSGPNNYRTRSLLYFDTSSIKGPVSEATLALDVQLRHEPYTKEEDYEIGAYRVLQRWEKPSWNTPLAFDSNPSARITIGGNNIYYITGLRDLVSSWVANPDANYGLILKGTNEETANIKEINSVVLTVTYEETNGCSAIGGTCRSSCGSGEVESSSYSCGLLFYKTCCVEAPPIAPPAPQPPEQIEAPAAQPEIAPETPQAQEPVSEPDETSTAEQQPSSEPIGVPVTQRQGGSARGPESVKCDLYDYNKNGRLDGGDSRIFNIVLVDNQKASDPIYILDDGRRMIFDIDGNGNIGSSDYDLLLQNPECHGSDAQGAAGTSGIAPPALPSGLISPPDTTSTEPLSIGRPQPPCIGDFDGDRKVDFSDFYLMADIFGITEADPRWNPVFNINTDRDSANKIDLDDFYAFADDFGKECGEAEGHTIHDEESYNCDYNDINLEFASAVIPGQDLIERIKYCCKVHPVQSCGQLSHDQFE